MTLEKLIASNPDPREVKRALAVKMRIQGLKHREIQPILGIYSSYISRCKKRNREQGVVGLRLVYQGGTGYLSERQFDTPQPKGVGILASKGFLKEGA